MSLPVRMGGMGLRRCLPFLQLSYVCSWLHSAYILAQVVQLGATFPLREFFLDRGAGDMQEICPPVEEARASLHPEIRASLGCWYDAALEPSPHPYFQRGSRVIHRDMQRVLSEHFTSDALLPQ